MNQIRKYINFIIIFKYYSEITKLLKNEVISQQFNNQKCLTAKLTLKEIILAKISEDNDKFNELKGTKQLSPNNKLKYDSTLLKRLQSHTLESILSVNNTSITYSSPTKVNCKENIFNGIYEIPIVQIEWNGMTRYSREFALGNEDIQAMINCYEDRHKSKDAIARLKRKYTAHYVNDRCIELLRDIGFTVVTSQSRKTEQIEDCEYKLPIFTKVNRISFNGYVLTQSTPVLLQSNESLDSVHSQSNKNFISNNFNNVNNLNNVNNFNNGIYNGINNNGAVQQNVVIQNDYQLCEVIYEFDDICQTLGKEWNDLLLNHVVSHKLKKSVEFSLPIVQTQLNTPFILSRFYQLSD